MSTRRVPAAPLTAFLVIVALLVGSPTSTLAGSAGIRNGAIQGVVYDSNNVPLAGVNVVAVRQISPPIIRSTNTDAMGNYFLGGMPLGGYILGFAKNGYQTISTATGNPANQTALGPQIQVYIESGSTAVAPAVNLQILPDTSNGTVNVRVVDLVSGTPIPNATVTVGPVAAASPSPDGVYTISAAALVDANGNPAPATLNILADGYQPFTSPITIVPHATQSQTFRVSPASGDVNGLIRATGVPPDLSQLAIVVDNVDPTITNARVNPNGSFTFSVPASNATLTRVLNVQFILPGYQTATVSVTAPRVGALTLMPNVTLTAVQVQVTGQVLLSTSQPAPSGTVILVELGQSAAVSGGNFTIQAPINKVLTLSVTALNSATGRQEQAQTTFTATSDGSATPVFTIPVIQTQ